MPDLIRHPVWIPACAGMTKGVAPVGGPSFAVEHGFSRYFGDSQVMPIIGTIVLNVGMTGAKRPA